MTWSFCRSLAISDWLQPIQDVPRMTVILNVVPIIVTWASVFRDYRMLGTLNIFLRKRSFGTFED